jgi:hypothetical protein
MNDWSVNVVGYSNQSGTSDIMTGSDSFAQSVRAYGATQAKHAPEAVTSLDVTAFLKKTDDKAHGGDGDGVFEKAEVEAYIKATAVEVSDYTNRFGTHDVMVGGDDFAYAVQALSAWHAYKEIGMATSEDVRNFLMDADVLNKEAACQVGVFEKLDVALYAVFQSADFANDVVNLMTLSVVADEDGNKVLSKLFEQIALTHDKRIAAYNNAAKAAIESDNSCYCPSMVQSFADVKDEVIEYKAADKKIMDYFISIGLEPPAIINQAPPVQKKN